MGLVSSTGPSPQERLQAIYDRARASFAENLATIDSAIGHLAEGALHEAERYSAERAAHRVAGAAGTVGFPGATAPARELEHAFAGGPGPEQADVLKEQAAALRDVLSDATAADEPEL